MTVLEKLRADIKAVLEERAGEQDVLDGARGQMEDVTGAAEKRGDGVLTAEETKAFAVARDTARAAKGRLAELDERREELEQRVDEIEASERARSAALRSAERFGGTAPTATVAVGQEERVYRPDGRHSFFRDAYFRRDDPDAHERIVRHQRQAYAELLERRGQKEERDATTGSFGALVIPQFLVEDFAPIARAGRPFANAMRGRPLPPEGMVLTVPRGNTATIVSSQTTENTAVAEQDYGVLDLPVPVRTIAGQVDVSRQSLDRGRGTDEVIMQDLAEAYVAELDRQVLAGGGANGEHFGILSTTGVLTVTVTSVGAITQMRQIADAAQRIHTYRKLPPSLIAVHPRRWGYWCQSVDNDGRPLIVPNGNGPFNAFSVGDLGDVGADGIVGSIFGVPVMQDANIPTTISTNTVQGATEDRIFVVRATDDLLYEDDPMPNRVRFEEVLAGQLTVKVVAWDYSAFTAGRYPSANVVLAGSGLTTPAFPS